MLENDFLSAFAHHQAGRNAEAERLYSKIALSHPNYAVAQHNMAAIALDAGDGNRACALLELALQAEPSNIQFWTSYINTRLAAGRNSNATQLLAKAAELMGIQRPSDAEPILWQALSIAPQDKGIRLALSAVLKLKEKSGEAQQVPLTGAELGPIAVKRDRPGAEEESLTLALAVLSQLTDELISIAKNAPQFSDGKEWLYQLRRCRLDIVDTLMGFQSPPSEYSLNSITAAVAAVTAVCKSTQLRSYERSEVENLRFADCMRRLAGKPGHEHLALVFAALLLSWHAAEVGNIVDPERLPPAARWLLLQFLFEPPELFLHAQDADHFANYLRDLFQKVLRYIVQPSDMRQGVIAEILQASLVQSYFNELNLRDLMTARAAAIERSLEIRGAVLEQLRILPRHGHRPKIGFITLGPEDSPEGAFLAAHLEHLDRQRYDVRLYSIEEPKGALGKLCHASVNEFVRISADAAVAVSTLRSANLDIAIFCNNITAVAHQLTLIAAHRVARLQMTTTASPVTTGFRNVDVMISGEANEMEDSQDQYSEHLVRLPGSVNCYPFQHLTNGKAASIEISRATLAVSEDAPLFFSSANFYKILPQVSALWIEILRRVPNSRLLLMPFGPGWSDRYALRPFVDRLARQLADAGLTADRIIVYGAVPTVADLHRIARLSDIYLDPFPFTGATSIFDALEVGLPIVARAGLVCRARHSKAILEEMGLNDWIAYDDESYVARAVALAMDPSAREKNRERLAAVKATSFALTDTEAYAAKLMPTFDRILREWDRTVEERYREEPALLMARISKLSQDAGRRLGSFSDKHTLTAIVLPYLRHWGPGNLVDVGACVGDMSRPFLDEGWTAVMCEPDFRCHPALENLIGIHGGRARLAKVAVSAGNEVSSLFHIAKTPGLSGFSRSPYDDDLEIAQVKSIRFDTLIELQALDDISFIKIDAEGHDLQILESIELGRFRPRMVMVEFGDQFHGQNRSDITESMRRMRSGGYRACVVCLRATGRFDLHEWDTELLAIAIDALPSIPADTRLFGNILFFRSDDADFLPALCDWLEQNVAGPERV